MTEYDSVSATGKSILTEKKSSKQNMSADCQKLDPTTDFLSSYSKENVNNFESGTDSLKCETNSDFSNLEKDSLPESDLICDFTEPHHLTMTIQRPEKILRLLSESNENSLHNSVNAIIRSQKDSNSPSKSSSKVLTSKEFCNYLKSYKLTIKPFGATESKSKTREISKTNFSTVSRWRCVVNRPKPKSNKLKWHHTNFVNKPRPPSAPTPPFVTSLAQAYQDLVTRDLALEETLKTTPRHGPSMYVTRQEDPCLLSASEVEKCDLQFFSIPPTDIQASNEREETESPLAEEADQLQDELYSDKYFATTDRTFETLLLSQKRRKESVCSAKSSRLELKQSSRASLEFGKDSAKPETQNKKDQTEAMEIQTHNGYTVQQQGALQPGSMMSHFFPEIDLPITDDILSDDSLFDDPNGFMKQFFTESSFVVSDLSTTTSCNNRGSYFKQTESQDPLVMATSSIVTPVTQEILPHSSPMTSPTTIERTPSYEHTSYVLDDYASSDSGIHSPESMTSPISDMYTVEPPNFFQYAVAPQPYSPKECIISDNVHGPTPSGSPEPQLWNLDKKFSEADSPMHTVSAPIFTQVKRAQLPTPIQQQAPSAHVPSPSVYVTETQTLTPKREPRVTANNSFAPSKPKSSRPKKTNKGKNAILWEFIRDILLDPVHCPSLIKWEDRNTGLFRFVQSDTVATMWGKKKGNPKMNYEKLSRAMRYYYNRGILDRVDGRRLVYKFGVNAHGWRKTFEPESPAKNIVPPSSPALTQVTESKMAISWLDNIESTQTSFQFASQEPNSFSSMEARSTTGHLVTLPSASVLLPKWETAL